MRITSLSQNPLLIPYCNTQVEVIEFRCGLEDAVQRMLTRRGHATLHFSSQKGGDIGPNQFSSTISSSFCSTAELIMF